MRQPDCAHLALIIRKDSQFWAFGHWSNEYPGAQLHSVTEPIENALWLRRQAVQVITDHGTVHNALFSTGVIIIAKHKLSGSSTEEPKLLGFGLER